MEKVILDIREFINKNKKEFWLLVAILVVGAFLRLFRISEYMTFLGDEGRDAIIVRKLLLYADPILIGPGTSIGNMYLGPLYYYLIAPFLFLFNYSPVGPSVMIALFGVATIFMVWKIGREWFSAKAGLIAAGLYVISPTVIIYNRSSWNPNIMPFFATLCVYCIWKIWQSREASRGVGWFITLGVSFALVLNSHYIALLLIPVLGFFWLLTFIKNRNSQFIKYSIFGLLLFLSLMSPLVIFDIRHGGNNFRAISDFFVKRETTVSILPWKAIPGMWPIYQEFTTRLLGGRNEIAGKFIAFGMFDLLVLYIFKSRGKLLKNPAFQILLIWLLVAAAGLALYKQHVYDHYYGFFFVAPFILFGALTEEISKSKSQIIKLITMFGICCLVFVNFQNSPLLSPPNKQLQRAEDVSKKVLELTNNEKFNFALVADGNYDSGYRYFLDVYNAKVVDIDPGNLKDSVQKNLFVVCEKLEDKCDPTHQAKTEISHFGQSKIDEKWNDFGVIIYKLGHSK